jgi:peptidoglycan L-alanyl-D-glutamate endopeptidase CwlK
MSRNLDDLNPLIKDQVVGFLQDCAHADIDVIVTCTRRTAEEQAVLYAQGRTTPGPIVTRAKPGQSAHNFGLAVDVAILVHGKLDWERASPLWATVGKLGQNRGLEWYGAPDAEFSELPHFQLPNWREHTP